MQARSIIRIMLLKIFKMEMIIIILTIWIRLTNWKVSLILSKLKKTLNQDRIQTMWYLMTMITQVHYIRQLKIKGKYSPLFNLKDKYFIKKMILKS